MPGPTVSGYLSDGRCSNRSMRKSRRATQPSNRRLERLGAILNEVDAGLITGGAAENQATADLDEAIKLRLHATAQEQRRLVEMGQVITPEQAVAFVMVIVKIIEKRVEEAKGFRAQIGNDLEIQLGLRDGGRRRQ